MPRVLKVIESDEIRGHGRNFDDPVRRVTVYHTLDGDLLAERDCLLSFDALLSMVRSHVEGKDRERFCKAVLETEPVL